MAIIDDLPGVKIEVTVEGVAREEHTDPDVAEDERTITRYIEAATGQEFVVNIELLPDFEFKGTCVAFEVSIDGRQVDSPTLTKSSTFRTISSKGVELAGGMIRKYRFADLETVNDGVVTPDEVAKAKDFGAITIACIHCTTLLPAALMERTLGANNIVSEKALKGHDASHNVEFMDAVLMPFGESNFFDAQPVEGEPMPAAIFTFRYRSLAALKSARIIPRTPSPQAPTPLEERDVDTLSVDELRELARKLKESQVKIKRERDDDDPPRRRKRARPNRRDTQLEIDEDGNVRQRSNSTATLAEPEIIELD